MGLSTMRQIEPEIYALYIISLDRNVSPQRIIKMHDVRYDKSDIVNLINSTLKPFWAEVGLGYSFYDANAVIKFIKKYNSSLFVRISSWFN